jgi:transposase
MKEILPEGPVLPPLVAARLASDRAVPPNVTLLRLPACSPELNPVERVWLYLRERHLSHRVHEGYARS